MLSLALWSPARESAPKYPPKLPRCILGHPWDASTCYWAVEHGHVEVLHWARENGCGWTFETRYRAAEELGYKDDLGNLACFC